MKKILMLTVIILFTASCSTYYGKYDYDRYFQNNEPYVTVDSEDEAADFIARKLARRFRRMNRQTLSVLSFTDEYGDRINRGDFFAGQVVSGLTRYRNPIVVERESLYEIIKERELTLTNLIDNEGYQLRQLLQADYILHGRILRGRDIDMISVRCFEVGTGEVVYAATVSIDYTPDPVYVPVPTPPTTVIIVDPGTSSPNPNPNPPTSETDDDDNDRITKPHEKPVDGIENKGKIDLNNKKNKTSDQYKKKTTSNEPVKKPSTPAIKKTVQSKPTTNIKKSTVTKQTKVVNKEPVQESEKEEVKKTTTSSKKSSALKK